MAGRPRKPTALKVMQGTLRPGRENAEEPQLPVRDGVYDPPAWLAPAAVEEWQRLEPILRESRVLTEGDLGAFANYCSRFAAARKADEYATGARTKKAWAYWDGIARKAWEAMNRAAQQLGLTPAARAKVTSGTKKAASPLQKYLRQARPEAG